MTDTTAVWVDMTCSPAWDSIGDQRPIVDIPFIPLSNLMGVPGFSSGQVYSAFQNDAENRNRNFSVAMQDPELS